MAYLIDTDIIIYNLKGHKGVGDWMVRNQNIPKFISVITYGELMYGAKKSLHRERNLATVNRVGELFQIIGIERGIIEVFAEIKSGLEMKGTRLEDMDLLIASTALYMNLTVMTNNKNHFARIPDLVLETWE